MPNFQRMYSEQQSPDPYGIEKKAKVITYKVRLKDKSEAVVKAEAVNMNIPFVFFLVQGDPVAWYNAQEVLSVTVQESTLA